MVGAADGGPVVREGARVLLLDEAQRLLMLRGHDPHQPRRSWWFTPGGGVEPGETPREAAVRELAEETGYLLEPDRLAGPVWSRTAVFDFMSRPFVQREVFFVARSGDAVAAAGQGWTPSEQETIDEVAWLTSEQLRDSPLEVFPDQLRQSWEGLARWDGRTLELGTVEE